MPQLLNQKQLQHLYLRGGFGLQLSDLRKMNSQPTGKVVDALLKASKKFTPLRVDLSNFPSPMEFKSMEKAQKQEVRKMSKQRITDLNIAWLKEMATSEAQLREKMSFFWHDHFACRIDGIRMVETQINTLRKHALGSFREMLFAISKDPAMLKFLNNQQNKKAHPNENFARELLELFTLSRGHYSEKDIQEAARAFTGWGFDLSGEFVFKKRQHDFEQKTFLGKTGNWGGEDILNIVLEQKQTARYITEKLYRFLVNPQLDDGEVSRLTDIFYASDYNIETLLRAIFTSDHFYAEKNIGARIKSPIEYLTSLARLLNVEFTNKKGPLMIQKVLGQVLFKPPNVSGWVRGTAWIDSSSMMTRLTLPQVMLVGAEFSIDEKPDLAMQGPLKRFTKGKLMEKLKVQTEWRDFEKRWGKLSLNDMHSGMADYLLQVPPSVANFKTLSRFVGEEGNQISMMAMRLVCTPEFQLC